jgi:NAD(P)-dependent dehydrogenase (short-subunit alcohol dehydrogenase family)
VRAAGAGNVAYVVTDVSKPEDNQRLMNAAEDKFGGVDVFIANAGVIPAHLFEPRRRRGCANAIMIHQNDSGISSTRCPWPRRNDWQPRANNREVADIEEREHCLSD